MSLDYETVEKLLGDFFERNTAKDTEGAAQVVDEIQGKLSSGELDSEPFKEYFNNLYAGRGAANVVDMAKDYPRESIIRELLQNVFGCDYDTPDIKVVIEFLDEGQVKLTYNETGFSLAQVFYYLSIGRTEGISEREGRFGLGAKSVFSNVDWFKMRSNTYSMRVVNEGGTLKVRDLELTGKQYNHTEIVFSLPIDEQKRLHENLVMLTSKKGDYINMVDLCFAFIRKRHLKSSDDEECVNRTFNIAVMNYGKPEFVYKIQMFRRDENDIQKVRFSENGKSVADFIHAERDGFIYLIPYAISGQKREAAKVLMSKYNYFSTFELTAYVTADNQRFVDEKLSAFFVSVPNNYITNNRSGIKNECIDDVSTKIQSGIMSIVEEYKKMFVLELAPNAESEGNYMLRPAQYVFEFFYNYISTSGLVKGLKEKFCDSISIKFPGDDITTFAELREHGFFSERSEVSKEEHEDGSAAKALFDDIDQLDKWYATEGDRTFMAKYNWNVAGTDEQGSEFLYAFYHGGEKYFMPSGRRVKDYELASGFKSIVSLKLSGCVVNGAIADEDALEEAFKVIDEMFGESYRISMKYFQFVVTSGSTSIQFEISKINIGNMKKAYDVLSAHEMRFENHQIYNQVITLMVNSFTNGKDVMQFLSEIKSQGGEVTLALDINKRYRFCAYGKQFMIPPNISNADLLDIVGDVYALIESGLFNNRTFDFPYSAGRFTFDMDDIMSIMPEGTSPADVEKKLSMMYVCDLGLDKIALLDADGKLQKIIDTDAALSADDVAKAAKLVVLRDGMTKIQYADFVEYVLTGTAGRKLRALYSGTEEPNIVLLDQIPYYYKPVPTVTRREFEFLREQVKRVAPISGKKAYKNYFARDINARLFGYGGVCPCCGYETGVINSFDIKTFSIGLLNGEKEQKFTFSLYLCANDVNAAGGWIIDDVSIGGMSPFLWLGEMAQIDYIPPEFLYCRIKYRRQVSYDICEVGESGSIMGGEVYEGAEEILDFVLSPMMAAKWYEDNLKAIKDAPKPETAPAPAPKAPEAKEAPKAPEPKEEAPKAPEAAKAPEAPKGKAKTEPMVSEDSFDANFEM